jgi:pyruvate/2-oxoglutarate dehydrogenase complex dihydrolipoamide acyltransferase (E2) component
MMRPFGRERMPCSMQTMSRTFRALTFVVCTTACSCGAPAKPNADAAPSQVPAKAEPPKAEPPKAEPPKAEPPKGDPILLKVCKAFDDVTAEGKTDQLLAHAAVRATELGVNEAQLEALGSQPPQLLASIRARGNPTECAAFVAYLEALP